MDDMMNNNSLVVGSNRKIDLSRRAHLKADMTPDDNRVELVQQVLPLLNGKRQTHCASHA